MGRSRDRDDDGKIVPREEDRAAALAAFKERHGGRGPTTTDERAECYREAQAFALTREQGKHLSAIKGGSA